MRQLNLLVLQDPALGLKLGREGLGFPKEIFGLRRGFQVLKNNAEACGQPLDQLELQVCQGLERGKFHDRLDSVLEFDRLQDDGTRARASKGGAYPHVILGDICQDNAAPFDATLSHETLADSQSAWGLSAA